MHNIFAPITATIRSSSIIIRISGNNLDEFFSYFALKKNLIPRKSYVIDLKKSGQAIDQVLLTFFKSPNSYTGEDVIEISHHGSQIIYEKIINELAKIPNFRFANPGEFTKRAFLNNKIDLLQAEAIDSLIKAKTGNESQIALKQLYGENSKYFNKIRDDLVHMRAYFEAYIDFPEDDLDPAAFEEARKNLANIITEINERINKDKNIPKLIESGIKIAIIGPSNAGKSSLINSLAKKEVAIVTNIAGTTRDALEVNIDLAGFQVSLIDTAGFRETSNEIEQIGINKAKEKIATSDLIILMIPADNLDEYDNYAYLEQGKLIKIINKIDLKKANADWADLQISLKEQIGIDKLLSYLEKKIKEKYNIEENHYITNQRQHKLCEELARELEKINLDAELVIIAEHLRRASNIIGRITGLIDIEEILDKLFSSFCIGK